jgi:acetyl-CoA synthetase
MLLCVVILRPLSHFAGGIKVSSVEIERVCNLVDGVSETAAIGVSPANGGPSQLILFVILKTPLPENASADELAALKASVKAKTQNAIKADLNPLFHIGDVVISDKLPRTASNKIMRRILRDDYVKARDAAAAAAAHANAKK